MTTAARRVVGAAITTIRWRSLVAKVSPHTVLFRLLSSVEHEEKSNQVMEEVITAACSMLRDVNPRARRRVIAALSDAHIVVEQSFIAS